MIRCGSGRRLLEDKPDIAALPVGTVSQGQIYESLVWGSRFKTMTYRNKAVALLAGSEDKVLAMRSAVQRWATGNIFLPAVCCRPKETPENCAVRHAFVGPRTNELTLCRACVGLDACGVIGYVCHCVTVLVECRSVQMLSGRRKIL